MRFIKAFCYILLFIILNLILGIDIIIQYLISVFLFIPACIADLFIHDDGVGALVFGIPFAIWIYLVYMLAKIFVLPLIFEFANKSNIVFDLLDEIRKRKILKFLVLVMAILTDIYTHKLFKTEISNYIYFWSIYTGNLFICYIGLLIWFKFRETKNAQKRIMYILKKGIITISIFVITITVLYFMLVLLYYFLK